MSWFSFVILCVLFYAFRVSFLRGFIGFVGLAKGSMAQRHITQVPCGDVVIDEYGSSVCVSMGLGLGMEEVMCLADIRSVGEGTMHVSDPVPEPDSSFFPYRDPGSLCFFLGGRGVGIKEWGVCLQEWVQAEF